MAIDSRKTCALILGGGAGKRLYPLTVDRAKPAVPFAGKYRLIDIPISNCLNSVITHVFVLTQFNSMLLHRHIQHTYQLDRFSSGFVEILAAEQNQRHMDWYQGTADAVRQNLWYLADESFSHALILAGDQIYRMDYRELLATHDRLRADLTLAVTPKRPEEASGLGVMKINAHYQVTDFVEKPTSAQMTELVLDGESLAPLGIDIQGPVVLASMGIYVTDIPTLTQILDNEDHDFGKHVIPHCIQRMRVMVHPYVGYWEDLGTINSFFHANIAMASWKPPFDISNEMYPVFTRTNMLPCAKLDQVALAESIVSEGSFIRHATIRSSVIGLRSIIRHDSRLEQVVMFGQDNYGSCLDDDDDINAMDSSPAIVDPLTRFPARGVGRQCDITRAILDRNMSIGDGVVITDHTGLPDEDTDYYYVRDGIVIIPRNAVIPAGMRI